MSLAPGDLRMRDKRAEFASASDDFKKIYGIDFASLVSSGAIGDMDKMKALVERIKGGHTLTADSLSVDKIMAANPTMSEAEAIRRAEQNTAMNSAIEMRKSMVQSADEAGKKLIEAAEAFKGYVDSSTAASKTFNDTTIQKMVQAIESAKNNNTSVSLDADVQAKIKELANASKEQAKALKEMSKEGEIKKAADAAEKKDKK